MKNELQPFQFGILRILDCGFFIEELIGVKHEEIKIGYGMNLEFNAKEEWIEFVIKAEFKDGKNDQTFLSGSTLTRFKAINLMAYVDENDKITFPDGSLETLFGIAFTHMRAILSKNVTGSRYGFMIVPPINPTVLFQELLRINTERTKHLNEEEV